MLSCLLKKDQQFVIKELEKYVHTANGNTQIAVYITQPVIFSHIDLNYQVKNSQSEDKGVTHRSGTEPPSWTCGRTAERTAGQDLLLCPPGNTSSCLS